MTNQEAIQKYNLKIVFKNGEKGLGPNAKPTETDRAYMVAHKQEIIAEIEKTKKETEEKEAAEKQIKIDNIKSGKTPLAIDYHDGEYLTGYQAFGIEAELLEEIKAAKYVSGWGTLIDDEIIKLLGTEFTYPQVLAIMTPKNEKAAADKAAAEKNEQERIEKIFATAKETGKNQVITKWTEECNDPDEECNVDIMYKYAKPDGSTYIQRVHSY